MKLLESKYQLYLKYLKTVQDEAGFIESHECDSLLFSGLLGSIPGSNVKIDAAFDGSLWHRRPLKSKNCCECYDPNRPEYRIPLKQKLLDALKLVLKTRDLNHPDLKTILRYPGSTISRDMLIGLCYYAYYNKRLDISEQIINYALKNWGVMGKGDPFRTNIMPQLFATFCWVSYRLGGPSRAWSRWIPVGTGEGLKDYQAHLQVLHVHLRNELVGKPSKASKALFTHHYRREPNNALFAVLAGDLAKAEELLEFRVDLWPKERLADARDRKAHWVFQRDGGYNWKPDPKGSLKPHSPADFLFCYWLLQNHKQNRT